MQKEMEIRMEKQIVELEKKFAQRITEMEEKFSSWWPFDNVSTLSFDLFDHTSVFNKSQLIIIKCLFFIDPPLVFVLDRVWWVFPG